MAYVVWSEMFSTGIPYIDNQHQKLFSITNDFHSALRDQGSDELIFRTLNSLIKYAEEHFQDEEFIMSKSKKITPEQLADHKEQHIKLIEDIFELISDLKQNTGRKIRDVELFLNSWLIIHILMTDKKLQEYNNELSHFVVRKQDRK
ncbi:MAG: hemerythrin family protein [Nitrospira sp.]|nr:hemerythrin family protein [bacterium]MBL7049165.1 hemerythrin family protein [Nitrospira sp.]